MLPLEPNLEVRSCLPVRGDGNGRKPPLLFVHGGYCDAWCWAPHFLPWFAARGYAAHALSLRGHGASGGRETMFVTGLDDFAADVEHVAAGLPMPPVLIGHSMGAAVIERLLATRPVRAAALLSPVPPAGLLPMAARLAAEQPEYADPAVAIRPGAAHGPRPRSAAALLFQPRRRPGNPRRGHHASLRGVAARAARPFAAPALAAAGAPRHSGVRAGRRGRPDRERRRRARDGAPPWRGSDARARPRAHADAGAAMAEARAARWRAGSPRWKSSAGRGQARRPLCPCGSSTAGREPGPMLPVSFVYSAGTSGARDGSATAGCRPWSDAARNRSNSATGSGRLTQ